MIGRKKKALFNQIKDRIWKIIQSWKGKHLSKAGQYGEMGFRHIYGFNLAMLGKQGWRLLSNPDAILSRVFKAKYFPRGNFLEAQLGHNPSYVWRSIHASQVVVKGGLRWCIGNGRSLKVWHDPWLRNPTNSYVTTPIPKGHENLTVAELIDMNERKWNQDLLSIFFGTEDIRDIFSIPLLNLHEHDTPSWKLSRKGSYSVKSAYYYVKESLISKRIFVCQETGNNFGA
uniref:Uncharacterized protein n=1 Tax=Cajanus cajan TaxID=3821 RepID=A0A151RE83_CAJCA|nr:hypothetical protein KK1_037728 [Cajanus cajan]